MIRISQIENPNDFSSTHYIITQTPDGMLHWTLTGVVTLSLKGTSAYWLREEVQIVLMLPGIGQKYIQLQQWAPFVTLSSIKNEQHAVNAGWAVDSFKLIVPEVSAQSVTISCDVAVRDIDGYIVRLGYVFHGVGSLVDPPYIG